MSQAVAINNVFAADKTIGFTATATTTTTATSQRLYSARVQAINSSGPVSVSVQAVGTVLERAPSLRVDAMPHSLTVSCRLHSCQYEYDGAVVIDGDGSGFDLKLPNAEAGRAYAFLLELPAGAPAAQMSATFYLAGAAAGAAGFEPVVSGPLGEWTTTPVGHESFAEHQGCTNEERSRCITVARDFGIHPSGAFSEFLMGTWVAPSSGPTLLRLVMNCDVPFFSDVQAEGCYIDQHSSSYGCDPTTDGTDHSVCASQLRLTVVPGAYFDDFNQSTREAAAAAGATTGVTTREQPVRGSAERIDTIVVSRSNIEARVAAAWQDTYGRRRLQCDGASCCEDCHGVPLESGCDHAPSFDDILKPCTPAHQILIDLFTVRKQPHVTYPLSTELHEDGEELHGGGDGDGSGGGGHRRLQACGSCPLVTRVETHGTSAADVINAQQGMLSRLPDAELRRQTPASGKGKGGGGGQGGRRLQASGDSCCPDGGCHWDSLCGLGASCDACTARGQTAQTVQFVLSQPAVEAIMHEKFEAMPEKGRRRLQASAGADGCDHPPSLAESLVSGSCANALLASIFVDEQAPLAIEPTLFTKADRRRRRLQASGDSCCPDGGCHWDSLCESLQVTIETHAATAADAYAGIHELAAALNGTLLL